MTAQNTLQDFPDLIASVADVLGRSFQGASLTQLFKAAHGRIEELKTLATQEQKFDINSLELGILKNLLAEMTSMRGVFATSVQLH